MSTITRHVCGMDHSQPESNSIMPSLNDIDTVQSIRDQEEKSSFKVLCYAKSLTTTIRIDYKHPIMRHLEPDLNTNLVSCSSSGLIISLDEYYNGNQLSLFCSLLYTHAHMSACRQLSHFMLERKELRICMLAEAYVSLGSNFKCLLPKTKSGNAMHMLIRSEI